MTPSLSPDDWLAVIEYNVISPSEVETLVRSGNAALRQTELAQQQNEIRRMMSVNKTIRATVIAHRPFFAHTVLTPSLVNTIDFTGVFSIQLPAAALSTHFIDALKEVLPNLKALEFFRCYGSSDVQKVELVELQNKLNKTLTCLFNSEHSTLHTVLWDSPMNLADSLRGSAAAQRMTTLDVTIGPALFSSRITKSDPTLWENMSKLRLRLFDQSHFSQLSDDKFPVLVDLDITIDRYSLVFYHFLAKTGDVLERLSVNLRESMVRDGERPLCLPKLRHLDCNEAFFFHQFQHFIPTLPSLERIHIWDSKFSETLCKRIVLSIRERTPTLRTAKIVPHGSSIATILTFN